MRLIPSLVLLASVPNAQDRAAVEWIVLEPPAVRSMTDTRLSVESGDIRVDVTDAKPDVHRIAFSTSMTEITGSRVEVIEPARDGTAQQGHP